jgi:hypothetical protein
MSIVDNASDIRSRLAAAEAALMAIGQRVDPVIEQLDVAVLIPTHANATSIADVVRGFHVALPNARIYVYDADSTDGTALIARNAGAIVRRESRRDAGERIRHMFADVDADIYILSDASGAYDPTAAPLMISRLLERQADMVSAARITPDKKAYHDPTNARETWLTAALTCLHTNPFNDMLTGYRAVSRRFAKSFSRPSTGRGPDADLVLHAFDLDLTVSEVQTIYSPDPRLPPLLANRAHRTATAMLLSGQLICEQRPMWAFAGLSAGAALLAILTPDLTPPAITATIAGGLALAGVGLETVRRTTRELRQVAFLSLEGLGSRLERLEDTRRKLDTMDAVRQRQSIIDSRPRTFRVN